MHDDDLSPYAYPITEDGDVFTGVGSGVRFVSVRDAYRRLDIGWLGGKGCPRGRAWSGRAKGCPLCGGERTFRLFREPSRAAHDQRLTQATASVPSAVVWFLLATLIITVTALGVCLPRRNNRGRLITLVVITALLTTALCIIRDVDRPFGGIVDVRPTAIAEAERQATRDFTANQPAAELPCDDRGDRRAV